MELLNWLEVFCRWTLGLQMIFWGLNGFRHWIVFENQPVVIDQFVKACINSGFIMPLVKIWEILGGLMLVLNFLPKLALIALYPIVGVVVLLHLLHNKKGRWSVVPPLGVPFGFLVIFHFI